MLTGTAGESLTDDEFLDAAALQPGTDGRIRLVLSFAQSDVLTFTPVHSEALGSMAASGFGRTRGRDHLEMDFGGLKAMGFEFVKLDAQVFLEGLQAPTDAFLPPTSAAICRNSVSPSSSEASRTSGCRPASWALACCWAKAPCSAEPKW